MVDALLNEQQPDAFARRLNLRGEKLSFSTGMLFTGAVLRLAVHPTVVTDILMSQN